MAQCPQPARADMSPMAANSRFDPGCSLIPDDVPHLGSVVARVPSA
jgi:hypothetical protein